MCIRDSHVHDLVDQVTKEAEDAGTYAAEYAAECAAAQQADAAVSTDAETAAAVSYTHLDVYKRQDHILIYADLGSSILSAETAIDLIDEDLAEKVQLVDAPIVEGALAGVVQGTISDDVADVIKASEDARNVHKN